MLLLRLLVLALAMSVALPARFAGWLVIAADCMTAPLGAQCRGAPVDEDDGTVVAAEDADADDDQDDHDEGADGQKAFVPGVLLPVFPARPSAGAIHHDGLTASSGVFGSVFRPPRANG